MLRAKQVLLADQLEDVRLETLVLPLWSRCSSLISIMPMDFHWSLMTCLQLIVSRRPSPSRLASASLRSQMFRRDDGRQRPFTSRMVDPGHEGL